MLCFANVTLFIYFLWPPYASALVNVGSRNFYTWWTLSVNREVTTWIFSWSSLNYRDGPKSDEIRHIFRSRPQTFCSHGRTRQIIVFLIKKLVKHRWLLYTCARFGELWPTNPWDPRVILLFLITNDIGDSLERVLFPFARWQHDYAQIPLPCETSMTRAQWPQPVARGQGCMCLHLLLHSMCFDWLQQGVWYC